MGVVLASAFTEVKPRFTEVEPRSTEVKARSTEVKPRLTEVKPHFERVSLCGNNVAIGNGIRRLCDFQCFSTLWYVYIKYLLVGFLYKRTAGVRARLTEVKQRFTVSSLPLVE